MRNEWEPALAAWREVLGAEVVSTDAAVLGRYGRGDVRESPQPGAVLKLASREQLVAAVEIANRFGVPVHPISRGQNWGYGAAGPVHSGQVTLDLSRMDKVIELDDEMAFVVVEPGVTQRQLRDYLRDHGDRFIMDCTDAPSDTSLVGNCLERGVGFSALGFRMQHCCGMEVVLADGTVVETGFAGLGHPKLAWTRKGGVGPDIEGLFSQSNMGVVSKLGMWLMPRPERTTTFWIAVEGDERYADLLVAFRDLMLVAGIRTVLHARNWLGRAGWVVFGGLYGTADYVAYAAAAVAKAAAGAGGAVHFADPSESGWQEKANVEFLSKYPDSGRLGDRMKLMVAILSGEPLDDSLFPSGHIPVDREGTTKNRHVSTSATCNVKRSEILAIIGILRKVLDTHGRSEPLWCAMADARTLTFVQHFFHKWNDAEAEQRSIVCYDEVEVAALAAGFPPYRLGNRSMARVVSNRTTYWDTVRRIKRALDPMGILAPGKYLTNQDPE